jgi:hypothetical protein
MRRVGDDIGMRLCLLLSNVVILPSRPFNQLPSPSTLPLPISRSPHTLQPIHPLRLIRQRSNPKPMPSPLLRVMNIIIRNSRVSRHPIIPKRHRPLLPLHSHLEVLAQRDMLEQQLQQGIRLLLPQTDDALCEAWVDEEGFLAG